MDPYLTVLWQGYRAALQVVYQSGAGSFELAEGEVSEEALGRLVERSEQLTSALANALPGEPADLDEIEDAALAVAATDVAVAADVFYALREEIEGTWPVEGERREPRVSVEHLEPMAVLLARADMAFGGGAMAGAAPGDGWVRVRTRRAIDELVDTGSPVAISFVLDIVSLELAGPATQFFGSLGPVRELVNTVTGPLQQATRLLRHGVGKILLLIGSDNPAEGEAHFLLDRLFVPLRERLEHIGGTLLRELLRADDCWERASDLVRGREELADVGTLDHKLDVLCRGYAKKMKRTEAIGRRFGYCAPIVSLISPPIGKLAVAAANSFGLLYVTYGLGDRLDAFPPAVSRTPGVPTSVEHCLLGEQ